MVRYANLSLIAETTVHYQHNSHGNMCCDMKRRAFDTFEHKDMQNKSAHVKLM